MKTYAHVYLSPHLDDAALSCGGRIWQQVQAGDCVLVVTVFAGAPEADAPLSPFAWELHAQWGLAADAPARRREEDIGALARLGADAAYWPYLDCIYRRTPDGRFPYASEEALFGDTYPTEASLITELTARLTALPLAQEGALYAPIGIGHHVDHQIVHRAAAHCERASVRHYEDYPYAEDVQAVQEALSGERWQVERTPLSERALEARIAAIACYRSQLGILGWASAAEMAAAVRAFAVRVGDGTPAEWYWRRA